MRHTLSAFYEEGSSFVRAARRLGVHENTVTYRVQRAEELLGHSVTELMETYAHALPNMQQDAAARLGALLHG